MGEDPEVVSLPNLRRRHRVLTIPSGAVLLACIFLPAVRVCSDPVYPIQAPIFWTPYVLGVIVGVGAYVGGSKGAAHVRAYAWTALVVMWATILGWGGVMVVDCAQHDPGLSLVSLLVTIACLLGVTERPIRESSLPRAGFVGGLLCCAWFGLLSFDGGAMIGAYLSLASSLGLTIGCGWWWSEIRSPAAYS